LRAEIFFAKQCCLQPRGGTSPSGWKLLPNEERIERRNALDNSTVVLELPLRVEQPERERIGLGEKLDGIGGVFVG
jgi:hypothetical protein